MNCLTATGKWATTDLGDGIWGWSLRKTGAGWGLRFFYHGLQMFWITRIEGMGVAREGGAGGWLEGKLTTDLNG